MLDKLISRYGALEKIKNEIAAAADLLEKVYRGGGKVLVCGNGGSAADSEHIVGELMKSFMRQRPLSPKQAKAFCGLTPCPDEFAAGLQNALPAISLPSQAAILSAFANDAEPDMVYAQLAYGYAREGDLLVAISTSGNSKNIVNAAIAAKARGAYTLALTGAAESRLSALCDITLRVPETETYLVQELHLPIYHYLCAEVERRLF